MSGSGDFDAAATLVVPMQIKAQVTTAENSQMFWERDTLLYGNLNTFASPVPEPFKSSNLTPPSTGVHLHWSLPRAFSQSLRPDADDAPGAPAANASASSAHFRPAPNRYLVVRMVQGDDSTGNLPAPKAWVLTSDEFSQDGASPFVNPFADLSTNPDQNIPGPAIVSAAMMGVSRSLAAYQTALEEGTIAENPELFLRAIGPGDVSFATFSPGVGNVFGFHDDLSDLEAGSEATLSYVVLGWISEAGADPLSPDNPNGGTWKTVDAAEVANETGIALPDGVTAVQVAEPLGWILPNTTQAGATRTLVQASVTDVAWNSSSQTPMPEGLGWYHSSSDIAKNVKVAIANSSAEGISELVSHIMTDPNLGLGYDKDQAIKTGVALEAMQYHALNELDSPGGRHLLRERIKRAAYETFQGGYDWQLIPSPGQQPDPLTPAQQTALGVLKQEQRQLDEAREVLHSMQSRLYSLWWMQYGIVHAAELHNYPAPTLSTGEDNPAFLAFQDAMTKLAISEGQTLSPPVQAYLAEVEAQAVTVRTLASGLPPTGGPGHEEAAQDYAANTLGVSGYTLQTLPRTPFFAPQDPALVVAGAGSIPPAPARAVVCKTASDADGQLPSGAEALPKAVTSQAAECLATAPTHAESYTQPWLPLYLDWSMTFNYACQLDADGNVVVGADGSYLPDMGAWQFDGQDYRWIGGAMDATGSALQQGYAVGITRRAFLTPGALKNIAAQLGQYGEEPGGEDVQDALSEEIAAWPLVSQSLSGLNAWLTMRDQDVNVAPAGDIKGHAGHQRYGAPVPSLDPSPDPTRSQMKPYFFPVRTGYWSVNKLQVRDRFGLTLNLNSANNSGTGQASSLKPILPPALTVPDGVDTYNQGLITAPPRMIQGARLDIRWIAATDDTVEVDLNPGNSPICGWFLPNHADRSLAVYDQGGVALGALRAFVGSGTDQALEWTPAPGGPQDVPGQGTEPSDIANPHLAGIVNALLARSDGVAALRDLMNTIDDASWSLDIGDEEIGAVSPLVGDAVAVVRANVQLQLRGLPITDQSYEQVFANPADPNDTSLKFNSGGVEAVAFDLRIGAPELRRDGVAAFFPGSTYTTAIAPAAPPGLTSDFVVQEGIGNWPQVTPAPTPVASDGQLDATGSFTATVLMDPRGALHVTSGIVPRARNKLPSDLVAPALAQMALSIESGPVLFDAETVEMPIPASNSGNWSWLTATANEAGNWQEVTPQSSNDTAQIAPGPTRLEDGWLVLTPKDDED